MERLHMIQLLVAQFAQQLAQTAPRVLIASLAKIQTQKYHQDHVNASQTFTEPLQVLLSRLVPANVRMDVQNAIQIIA